VGSCLSVGGERVAPRIQIFADTKNTGEGSSFPFPEEHKQHLLKVLRLSDGDTVAVICHESNRLCQCSISSSRTKLTIVEALPLQPTKSALTSVAVALCKGKKNELILEKLTELGAEHILFWVAERSISRVKSDKDRDTKIARFEKLAESAAMQSSRTTIPKVTLCCHQEDLLSVYKEIAREDSLKLLLSLAPEARLLRNFATSSAGVHLLIGPEGDLTDREAAEFISNGFKPTSLGSFILRSETAAIASAAIVQGLWGFDE
jgi:16S rRNA (uracil1498-N3)-methyltransferase